MNRNSSAIDGPKQIRLSSKRRARNFLLALFTFSVVGLCVIWVEFILTRGRTPSIRGEHTIASLEVIRLGGADQWVLIRGHDRTNPVLLFLHGSPGMPAMFLAHAFQRELERDFVVVHWDRRGAGKSFSTATAGQFLSVSQTLEDTCELTRILRGRFGKDRITLIGHSWGSYLGLLALRAHPEYYTAFVGMGQLAGTRSAVQETRRQFIARAARDTSDQQLSNRIADGVYQVEENDLFRYGGELHSARSFWPILRTGLFAPEYTLWEALNVKKGADAVAREMHYDLFPKPLEGEITRFEVPILFFLGRHDYNTPSQLAADYLDRVDCPLKEVVWFENSAHFPFFEEPDRFHVELIRTDRIVRGFWARHSGR